MDATALRFVRRRDLTHVQATEKRQEDRTAAIDTACQRIGRDLNTLGIGDQWQPATKLIGIERLIREEIEIDGSPMS